MAVFSQHIGRPVAFPCTSPEGQPGIGLITDVGPGCHKGAEKVVIVTPDSGHGSQLIRWFKGVFCENSGNGLAPLPWGEVINFVKRVIKVAYPGVDDMFCRFIKVLRQYKI